MAAAAIPPDQDAVGTATLFMPERLFLNSPSVIPATSFPACLTNLGFLRFPLHPAMFAAATGRMPSQRCTPMYCTPLRTSERPPNAPPSLPEAIEEMAEEHRVNVLKRCSVLWQNLKAYTEVLSPVNTWNITRDASCPPELRLPPALQQARGILQLFGWILMQTNRYSAVPNCEMSVQDEVRLQLLVALDALLQTRYPNRAYHRLTKKTLYRQGNGWRAPDDYTQPYNTVPVNQESELDSSEQGDDQSSEGEEDGGEVDPLVFEAPFDVFFPQWSRPVAASHFHEAGNDGGPSKAAFADALLFKSASLHSHGVSEEIKPHWSTPDYVLYLLYSAPCAERGTGQFDWNSDWTKRPSGAGQAVALIKQTWSQLRSFRTNWGFLTNGSKVIVYIKTGPKELCLSEPHDWTDPDVLQAILGLSFASIDCKHGSQGERDLINALCPETERKADWENSTWIRTTARTGGVQYWSPSADVTMSTIATESDAKDSDFAIYDSSEDDTDIPGAVHARPEVLPDRGLRIQTRAAVRAGLAATVFGGSSPLTSLASSTGTASGSRRYRLSDASSSDLSPLSSPAASRRPSRHPDRPARGSSPALQNSDAGVPPEPASTLLTQPDPSSSNRRSPSPQAPPAAPGPVLRRSTRTHGAQNQPPVAGPSRRAPTRSSSEKGSKSKGKSKGKQSERPKGSSQKQKSKQKQKQTEDEDEDEDDDDDDDDEPTSRRRPKRLK